MIFVFSCNTNEKVDEELLTINKKTNRIDEILNNSSIQMIELIAKIKDSCIKNNYSINEGDSIKLRDQYNKAIAEVNLIYWNYNSKGEDEMSDSLSFEFCKIKNNRQNLINNYYQCMILILNLTNDCSGFTDIEKAFYIFFTEYKQVEKECESQLEFLKNHKKVE